jgi:hypothetical protein
MRGQVRAILAFRDANENLTTHEIQRRAQIATPRILTDIADAGHMLAHKGRWPWSYTLTEPGKELRQCYLAGLIR